jgi:hypothetical protein
MINYRALTRSLFRAFATKTASKKPKTDDSASTSTPASEKKGIVS